MSRQFRGTRSGCRWRRGETRTSEEENTPHDSSKRTPQDRGRCVDASRSVVAPDSDPKTQHVPEVIWKVQFPFCSHSPHLRRRLISFISVYPFPISSQQRDRDQLVHDSHRVRAIATEWKRGRDERSSVGVSDYTAEIYERAVANQQFEFVSKSKNNG